LPPDPRCGPFSGGSCGLDAADGDVGLDAALDEAVVRADDSQRTAAIASLIISGALQQSATVSRRCSRPTYRGVDVRRAMIGAPASPPADAAHGRQAARSAKLRDVRGQRAASGPCEPRSAARTRAALVVAEPRG
jgi:hypothetical protein